MKNTKAFTLIELLATIIIVALLLVIAIPAVSRYIASSRANIYIKTLDSYADGAAKMVANGELSMMLDEEIIYYIPFNCINMEKAKESPYGAWNFAYVLLTNRDGKKHYYLYTKDIKNFSVIGSESVKLKRSDVHVSDHEKKDIIAVDGKNQVAIVSETCDFNNLVSSLTGIQPMDSCFNITGDGTITKWNVKSKEVSDSCYTKNLKIPDTINGITVTKIDSMTDIYLDGVFYDMGLESVVIPETVTTIGVSTFEKNKLTSVKIPDAVNKIKIWAFANNNISSINIPDSLTEISNYSFSINRLTTIKIPPSVTKIGVSAFNNNILEELVLSPNLANIGYKAFASDKLKKVDIPATVTRIEVEAFIDNPSLINIRMIGRSNLNDMDLYRDWNGTATITFAP